MTQTTQGVDYKKCLEKAFDPCSPDTGNWNGIFPFTRSFGEMYTQHTLLGNVTINALIEEDGIEIIIPILSPYGKTANLSPNFSGADGEEEYNKSTVQFAAEVGRKYDLPTQRGVNWCYFKIQGDTKEIVIERLRIAAKVVPSMVRVWGNYAHQWPPKEQCSLDALVATFSK